MTEPSYQDPPPRLIALMIVRATLLAYPELLPELVSRLERRGLQIVMFLLEHEGDVDDAMRRISRYQICAAIAAARPSEESIARLQRDRVPVVLYNCFNRGGAATIVSCDHAQCGRTLTSLLMDGGHKRFGIIGSPTDSLVGTERLAGVLDVLRMRGARAVKIVEGDYTHASGGPALDRLFASMKPRPSAVIAANDAMAIGAIDRALELGIRVPRDLSVVGFDGTQAATWPSHRLTTMRQPLAHMADSAVDLLCKLLAEPRRLPETRLFAAELVPGRTARFAPRRRGPRAVVQETLPDALASSERDLASRS
jgi:DNA-binding LacI/PurR family transcriptional regulator